MHHDIVPLLYSEYQANGYISENRVLDALIGQNLPLDEIDAVCETLLKMGVIIRDDTISDEFVIYDRSQLDYELLYKEVIDIDDSLAPLIKQIREIVPPQYREWRTLIQSAQNGNAFARERIILMNMRVVVKIALWHYKKYGIPIADAIQDGGCGLIVALVKYDMGRQENFLQYASFWIRQYIMRKANPVNPLIHYPTHYMDRLLVVLEVVEKHSCPVCDDFIACPYLVNGVMDKLSCASEEALEMLSHFTPLDSIERLLDENECIFSDNGYFVAQMSEEQFIAELRQSVIEILSLLDERCKKVLIYRFGLFANANHTLEEVGNLFGVTRERARQIEAKALKRLRKSAKINCLKIFW